MAETWRYLELYIFDEVESGTACHLVTIPYAPERHEEGKMLRNISTMMGLVDIQHETAESSTSRP